MKRFLSLLFIPQEKNNHRASLLQPKFLFLLMIVYLSNQSFIKTLTVIKPGVLGYSSEITAEKVFIQTNQQRLENNLPSLHFNSTLSISAQKKAEDMFTNNYWAHTSPSGKTPWSFLKEVNYQYKIAGENLAKDFYDTESLMNAWMNSPTHKANIVNQKYDEIGIAVVNGVLNGVKTTLVVQHFGSPLYGTIANTTPEEEIYNSSPLELTDSQQVLSANSQINLSPLFISKIVGLLMFIIMIFALIIDAFVTIKNNTHRLTGSSIGHLGFLIIILLFMLFTKQGVIF